jgi:hypothetical protein
MQLCIIDSLWGMKVGPRTQLDSDVTPVNRIAMGTFAPLLDYAFAKEVRETVMGATHDATTLDRFWQDFGFNQGIMQKLTNVTPAGGSSAKNTPAVAAGRGTVSIRVTASGQTVVVGTESATLPAEVGLYRLDGSSVCRLGVVPANTEIAWDKKDAMGRTVGSGVYLVKVKQGNKLFIGQCMIP